MFEDLQRKFEKIFVGFLFYLDIYAQVFISFLTR
jgi:hypothetical protein